MSSPASNPGRLDRLSYSALWLLEHLVGSYGPVVRARQRRSDNIAAKLQVPDLPLLPVPEETDIQIDAFARRYRDLSRPVVLRGAAKHWPAITRWSPEFFAETYPDDPVILFGAGMEDLESLPKPAEHTTLQDFARRLRAGTGDYARFLPLLEQHRELVTDFDGLWLRSAADPRGRGMKFQFFMGGADTSTSMHSALGSNLFVQVYGRKRWWIYGTQSAALLHPPVDRSVFFRSQVNAEQPAGNFAKAQGWVVDLEPGDVLFNPPFFWHQARNLDAAIGVGFRWFGLSAMLRSSAAQLLMTLTASNPSIWSARNSKGNFAKLYADQITISER